MEQVLRDAIAAVHAPDAWVHLATIGPDGEPHVTPMMMGLHQDGLLFSMTGKQKKRNIRAIQRSNRFDEHFVTFPACRTGGQHDNEAFFR